MTCAEFDRWLNEGCPGAGHAPALAHARECARCAGAWAGALEIDRRLTSFTPATPAGFAARVMTRVGAAPRRAAPWSPPDPMDWWVRAAADPATVLALALAAVTMWRGDAVARVAMAFVSAVTTALANPSGTMGAGAVSAFRAATGLTGPHVALALALAALPFMLWSSWRLFRWSERACLPAPSAARGD